MTDTLVAGRTAEEYRALEDRLVQAARDLRPDLLAAAAEAEQLTHIPPHIQEKLEAAGLYLMLIPRAHGGLEVNLETFCRVVIEPARGDMGMAWNFCLSANHALMFANWFPVAIHEEVYDGGKFKAASMYAPSVKAVKADGGYVINGVVNYCSGIPYSTHFIGQTLLEGTKPDGSPRVGLYIAPAGTYEILDDWGTTLGLNSSGSNSIRFTDAFLPAKYMIEDADLTFYAFTDRTSPGEIAYGNPMYNARHMSSFAMMLGMICVGAGYGALDEYENQMRKRNITVPPFTSRTLDPDFQRYYGGGLTNVRKAEFSILYAWQEWARLTETPNGTGGNSFTEEADILLGNVGRELMIDMWNVVNDLFQTVGSAAAKKGERFERIFRDMAQAAGHRNPQLRDFSYRLISQHVFGVVPNA